jgi:hypothetical protein
VSAGLSEQSAIARVKRRGRREMMREERRKVEMMTER